MRIFRSLFTLFGVLCSVIAFAGSLSANTASAAIPALAVSTISEPTNLQAGKEGKLLIESKISAAHPRPVKRTPSSSSTNCPPDWKRQPFQETARSSHKAR